MMRRLPVFAIAIAIALSYCGIERSRGDEIAPRYKEVISKGLGYLARVQHRDGHWDANGGTYPTTMTALAGLAMLMEGSTIREGKYKDNIRRAADWLMAHSMPNGMIGNPNIPGEAGRYMYGHGFATLFLSCVVGEEEEGRGDLRREGPAPRQARGDP